MNLAKDFKDEFKAFYAKNVGPNEVTIKAHVLIEWLQSKQTELAEEFKDKFSQDKDMKTLGYYGDVYDWLTGRENEFQAGDVFAILDDQYEPVAQCILQGSHGSQHNEVLYSLISWNGWRWGDLISAVLGEPVRSHRITKLVRTGGDCHYNWSYMGRCEGFEIKTT